MEQINGCQFTQKEKILHSSCDLRLGHMVELELSVLFISQVPALKPAVWSRCLQKHFTGWSSSYKVIPALSTHIFEYYSKKYLPFGKARASFIKIDLSQRQFSA